MKDPSQNIEDAIHTLLDGNVTYNGKDVKCFKWTPSLTEAGISKGALYHYIEIGEITDTETELKESFTHDCTVEVEIIVGYPGVGSKVVHNNITNQVIQLIAPSKPATLDLGDDFSNHLLILENKFELIEQGTHKIARVVLRYRLEITET